MNSKFRLWTPVANALEAYRRRVLRDPLATYEHIWRLIHIHEAMVVCLASALASRLMAVWRDAPASLAQLNRLRSKITGIPESDEEASLQQSSEICFNGSIKAWIEVLQVFGKADVFPQCAFCRGLANYLSAKEPNKELLFLEAWRRISPVPSSYAETLSRIQRFDAINSLRNKLAHVPLPERILVELHRGLRSEVLASLSPKFDTDTDAPTGDIRITTWHPALCGRILTHGFYITGSDIGRCEDGLPQSQDLLLQPTSEHDMTTPAPDTWVGSPFFNVDGECKASLLFRIPEIDLLTESVPAEYHRFAAEFEPVQRLTIPTGMLKPWEPQRPALVEASIAPAQQPPIEDHRDEKLRPESPTEAEMVPPVEPITVTGAETAEELRRIAESTFRQRAYSAAAAVFEALAQKGSFMRYNDVAKSKHGAALWRSAVQSENMSANEKTAMIKKAVAVLKQATHHTDPRYQARSYYELSKALYHLWKLTALVPDLAEALKAAETAARLDYEPAYVTWIERVQDEVAEQQGAGCPPPVPIQATP